MDNEAEPTQILNQSIGSGPGGSEPPAILSNLDRRYQFTAPDEPPRYGLIAMIVGSLLGLVLLTVVIANLADSSPDGEADDTVAGVDTTEPQQSEQDPSTPNAGLADDGPADPSDKTVSTDSDSDELDSDSSIDEDGGSDSDAGGDKTGQDSSTTSSVPSLLGKQQAQAEAILKSLGISYSVVEKTSTTFAKGTVVTTTPEAGKPLAKGKRLTVYVSNGPSQIRVPEVLGVKALTAIARLADSGLGAALVDTQSATAEVGTVIAADPPVGTKVEGGKIIKLSVSAGPGKVECVEVPNTVGQKSTTASDLMTKVGLIVQTEEIANTAAADTVISTSPSAGLCVKQGSSAVLTVSCASDPIPNVVGRPVDALGDAGFKIEKVLKETDSAPAGTVLSTTPAAGTRHCFSSPVQAQIASAPDVPTCNVAVPNLVGLHPAEAQAKAAAAGLTYGQSLESHPTIAKDLIVGSLPTAGTTVCAGTEITVVVSTGPAEPDPQDCTITVPNIDLKSKKEAVDALKALGLAPSSFLRVDDQVPAGLVIDWGSERKVPNGQFCEGDRIFLTVSAGPNH